MGEFLNLELIHLCKDNLDCKDKFSFVPTSRGICTSMNSLPFLSVVKENDLTRVFNSFFPVNLENYPEQIVYGRTELMLDLHNKPFNGNNQPGKLHISLTDHHRWFDQHESSVQVTPGYRTQIRGNNTRFNFFDSSINKLAIIKIVKKDS